MVHALELLQSLLPSPTISWVIATQFCWCAFHVLIMLKHTQSDIVCAIYYFMTLRI
jgi:hypothetical protein